MDNLHKNRSLARNIFWQKPSGDTQGKNYVCVLHDSCVFVLQRIRSTVDEKEQKQLLMDLDVVMRSSDCPYIVQFYGALFREVSLSLSTIDCIGLAVCKG